MLIVSKVYSLLILYHVNDGFFFFVDIRDIWLTPLSPLVFLSFALYFSHLIG